ncbi:HpcH/HpaI aldolase family protein [Nocardioides humi]|uniref:Aldolase/citrate lyase family protein n=1 Tax=Nocardioides humi TaxID=449461 RepID=A0ABN2BYJ4_9ACTN|nr:aldolase/citrate lyase family protein [Nocardioides humi]
MNGLGGWCHVDSPYVAEVMGSAGFDWCCIDMQHGLPDRTALLPMVQALDLRGCPTVVRVPEPSDAAICHALDAGACGVIVPMVGTASRAHEAVSRCHYPPDGVRSFGPLRAKLGAPTAAGEDEPLPRCYVMIEDRSGLENLHPIAATPGVSGIFLGPADLGLSLWGDPARTSDDAMLRIGAEVARACDDAGIVAGVFAGGPSAAATWRRLGFTMIALDSDSSLLMRASRALVAESRTAMSNLEKPAY